MCATPEDLLAALAFHDGSPLPRTALEEIIRRKDEMTPHLLDSLGKCLEHPGSFLGGERQLLPVYAGYLLAQFREPRAFPLLIALFAHRSKELGELWSDTVLGDMGNLLASVYDGNETLLHTLVENPNADEYVRGNGAIGAYLALLSSGRIPSDAVETYFRELLEHKLEREPSNVWDMLATAIGELGLVNLLALIRAANEEGLCDPWCGSIEQVEELALKGGRPDWKTEYHLIEDAIGEMTDWDCFSPLEKLMSMFELPEPFDAASPKNRTTPIRVSVPVTGRNEPCPCGSGKKFKKCCGDGAAIMAKREVMLAQPLRVRISLCGTDPEVWRELVVPGRFTLLDLHRVIQLVMPWDGGHLHCFTHAGKSYYAEREWANSRKDGLDHEMLLHDLNPDADLVYTYDFGDNWCHDVQVFRDAPAAADLPLPRCLGGANACPPDDVGGIGGYYHALEILKNPEAEDHDHFVEWLGADFDPTAFDVADANANLEKWGRQPRS